MYTHPRIGWVYTLFQGGDLVPTRKHNMRIKDEKWTAASTKAARLRKSGHRTNVTDLVNRALDQFNAETDEESIQRLGLTPTAR